MVRLLGIIFVISFTVLTTVAISTVDRVDNTVSASFTESQITMPFAMIGRKDGTANDGNGATLHNLRPPFAPEEGCDSTKGHSCAPHLLSSAQLATVIGVDHNDNELLMMIVAPDDRESSDLFRPPIKHS